VAEENVKKVILDLDNADFIKKLKESLGLMDSFGKNDSMGQLAGTLSKVGKMAGLAAAAVFAVKGAIDLVQEAEEVHRVENSFNMLAQSAGLAGSTIRDGVVGAAKGLADDTEIIKAANKALISMGESAKVIPQTMEIARKATKVFGGDLVSNFESINSALASGNAKALRNYGIIVDTEKATKDYAKSIGTTSQFLSEAGKKQAIMNAALEQAQKKFKDVDESTGGTADNITKLMVNLGQLKEAFALAFEKFAGPAVRAATDAVAYAAGYWAEKIKSVLGVDMQKDHEAHQENLKKEIQLHEDAGKAAEKSSGGNVDYEKIRKGREKFEQDLINLRDQRLQAEMAVATTEDEVFQNQQAQRLAIIQEEDAKRAELKRQYLETGLINEQQYHEAVRELEQGTTARIQELNMQTEQARLQALDNAVRNAKTASEGFSAAFAKGSTEARLQLQSFGNLGTVAFNAVKTNAVSAFKAMGDGSKTAGEAIKGFILGAIADTAEAKGTEMLLAGIWPPNPAAIAGGGALIALSAMLRSQSKSSGGGLGASAGGGSGGGAPSAATADAQAKPEPQEQARKAVSVNIQGSYFETDQTRTRLMDMIRESGDFTDFNLKQIGQT